MEGLGGLFTSILSCTLLAELAVGRIILARNPSFTGFVPTLLVLDPGRSLLVWLGREARDACLRILEFVGVVARWPPLVAVFKEDGFLVRLEVAVPVPWRDVVPAFAADDRDGVVAELGRRAGLLLGAAEGAADSAVFREVRAVAALVAGFKVVRLGLCATVLADSSAVFLVVDALV